MSKQSGLLVEAATAEEFLNREYPAKEPLIEHLLHRRDLVALGARRRNGKTTFLTDLGVALAMPARDFLGYAIPERRRTLMLALEDDPGEYQSFLRRIVGENKLEGAFKVMTRDDFHSVDINIDAGDEAFQLEVMANAVTHESDVVIVDNLAHVVNADFNDSRRIHNAMKFFYRVAAEANSAVIIAAHPRKEKSDEKIRLEDDKVHFFESIMGSSMFINTTGSLWGLERREDDDVTVFVGGRQRSEGTDAITYIQRDESGWFKVIDTASANLPNVLNTTGRQQAWAMLPRPGRSFSYTEGEAMVKGAMSSKSTYAEWIRQCKRIKVIVDTPDRKLTKAQGCG